MQWKNGDYLVYVDYFSRYIEGCNLPSNTTARQVIERCKAVFTRFGCPEVLVSDNGPQFSSHEFAQFAKDFDFTHVTSSPRYTHNNGEVETAVKTVKSLLAKEGDFHKALMVYRATPPRPRELSSTAAHGEEDPDSDAHCTRTTTTTLARSQGLPGEGCGTENRAAEGLQSQTLHTSSTTSTNRTEGVDHANKDSRDCHRPCTHVMLL